MPVGKFAKTSNTFFKGVHIGGGDHPIKPDPHIHIGPATVNQHSQQRVPNQPNQFYVSMQNPFAQNPYERPINTPTRINMPNPYANKNNTNLNRFDWN